eukprot:COSAG02_NODE_1241_length_13704_cov_3.128188_7_plen_46_part_00
MPSGSTAAPRGVFVRSSAASVSRMTSIGSRMTFVEFANERDGTEQ